MARQAAVVEIGARPFAAVIEEADVVVALLERLDGLIDETIELRKIRGQIIRQRVTRNSRTSVPDFFCPACCSEPPVDTKIRERSVSQALN
jgi:hypothetical protein